jgi:hypothetical protein
MNTNRAAVSRVSLLEDFAAELTAAAYSIALEHGTQNEWLDLELQLWRALADTIKKWRPELSQPPVRRMP